MEARRGVRYNGQKREPVLRPYKAREAEAEPVLRPYKTREADPLLRPYKAREAEAEPLLRPYKAREEVEQQEVEAQAEVNTRSLYDGEGTAKLDFVL